MVATLTLRVYTGTNAGTESATVTGIDMISADNATNSLANRQANPISVGTKSYDKWLKLKLSTAPDNGVTNFLVWGDGAVASSTTLMVGANQITGVTPVATTSSVATTTFAGYTSGNKLQWDATSYSATDDTTRYLVFQLVVDADANPGNWGQETVSFSFDET